MRQPYPVPPHPIDPRCTHAQLIKTATTNLPLFNNLITTYSRSNLISDASRLFNQIQSPNVVTYTAMISAQSNHIASLHRFISMLRHPIIPNQRTLASLFKTCASLMAVSFGLQLHGFTLKNALSKLPFTGSALVNFYSKCGVPRDALKVFDEIPERDEVCYAAVIVGLAQNNEATKALCVFSDMKVKNVESTVESVSGAIRAAAELAAFEQCRIIHGHSVVAGFEGSIVVGTSLVDGYGKAGIVTDARRVFDEMLMNVNVFGWNAMMAAYAQQGDMNSVVELFNGMKQKGVRADEYSFLAILTACGNAGLVIDAEQWLRRMSQEYGVEPGLEHYTCVIGALSRAGELADAKLLSMNMPFEPDAAVWRALLSASAVHGDTKMALEMGETLLNINSQDDSAYAILANVLAAAKSWDDVAGVRKLMKDRRVRKEIGRSWVEVRGEVHEFFAGDKRHKRTVEIYNKLEEIMDAIGKLGYKEVTSASLHDAGVEEKKKALWYHSEKLAVAFGVLSDAAPPGKALRIVKNLRICKDCHEAFKYMSRVIEREIVVRDFNRYHRFINGDCTCGDYW
ncbi:hypothetical protein ACHQM5_029339 [Ranunculus cassubicifolius]